MCSFANDLIIVLKLIGSKDIFRLNKFHFQQLDYPGDFRCSTEGVYWIRTRRYNIEIVRLPLLF